MQSWLAQQQQQMRASSNITKPLMPKTASLEQAGGLHRMVLRGHSGPIQKVLLAPGGTDVITGIFLFQAHLANLLLLHIGNLVSTSNTSAIKSIISALPTAVINQHFCRCTVHRLEQSLTKACHQKAACLC